MQNRNIFRRKISYLVNETSIPNVPLIKYQIVVFKLKVIDFVYFTSRRNLQKDIGAYIRRNTVLKYLLFFKLYTFSRTIETYVCKFKTF